MTLAFGDFGFGDFGVSFASTVAGLYTRWGGPRLFIQGEPLVVLTRGPHLSRSFEVVGSSRFW